MGKGAVVLLEGQSRAETPVPLRAASLFIPYYWGSASFCRNYFIVKIISGKMYILLRPAEVTVYLRSH